MRYRIMHYLEGNVYMKKSFLLVCYITVFSPLANAEGFSVEQKTYLSEDNQQQNVDMQDESEESSSDELNLTDQELKELARKLQRPPAWYDPFLDRILNKIATIPGALVFFGKVLDLHSRLLSQKIANDDKTENQVLIPKEEL